MNDSREVKRLMSLAYELSDNGHKLDAEGAFLAAAKLAPSWSVPWYELGLLCKYQERWLESLEYNARAAELDPTDEASWWNMGIAAMALSDWAAARGAWAECGIRLPEGEGPPDTDLGPVPLRLDPNGVGEVVWARRIDPARARIVNVPLPTTRFRWHDVVLHDGAPEGHRILDGREVPVFNVLNRLQPSGFETFVVELGSSSKASIDLLEALAGDLGGAAEDWGTATHILCRECSLGTPHEHLDGSNIPAHPHCGVAARDKEHAEQILDAWLNDTPTADVVRWYVVESAV
jgi:tetratricopeptide (TPR) repeat protein